MSIRTDDLSDYNLDSFEAILNANIRQFTWLDGTSAAADNSTGEQLPSGDILVDSIRHGHWMCRGLF
ncbi:MAG: hypothetical protein HY287_04390 [Planctomycetes bacterium]|nr:hypothetical protein [Planctomycetota bacterium]MBI3833553.1 hypothetical protein [Planctomycetota bacterium]